MRKQMMFLCLFILAFGITPVFAQDDDTQTFISDTGLVFDYPTDWFTNEESDFNTISVGNDMDSVLAFDAVNDDSVVMNILFGSNRQIAEALGIEEVSPNIIYQMLLDNIADSGTELFSDELLQLGDKEVRVVVGGDASATNIVYITTVDGNLFVGVVFSNDPTLFDTYRPTFDAIIASLRYEANTSDTPANDDTVTEPAELGDGAFVYYQSLDPITSESSGIEALLQEIVQLPDGTVLVTTGRTFFTVDVETGALSNPVDAPEIYFAYTFKPAPDGSLWAYDLFDGVIRIGTNFEPSFSTGLEAFGENFSFGTLATDDSGNVYLFGNTFDDAFNVIGVLFIFNDVGEVQHRFITNDLDDERNSFGFVPFTHVRWIGRQADGSLLLIDENLHAKMVDVEGNQIGERFQYGDDPLMIASRLDVAEDGTLFVLTTDGVLQQYAPDGTLLAQIVGTPQTDNSAPWHLGELPNYSTNNRDILALDSNRVIVVGSNSNYSLLTLVDFSQLEAE